jgi:phosphatidylglycerophosphatase A
VPVDNRNPQSATTSLALAFATVGGVGYIPLAPGTFGSAVGLLVWWLLPPSAAAQSVAIVVLFALGCWAGNIAEHHFGRTDPGHVVIDEVVGVLITLFMNPVTWKGAIAAFLAFRVMDIIKPFPANRLEHLHGGLGVMADDAMAAVYANVAMRVVILASGNWVIW